MATSSLSRVILRSGFLPEWYIAVAIGLGADIRTKMRYLRLKKNTLQLKTLFALSNLWMVRHQWLAAHG